MLTTWIPTSDVIQSLFIIVHHIVALVTSFPSSSSYNKRIISRLEKTPVVRVFEQTTSVFVVMDMCVLLGGTLLSAQATLYLKRVRETRGYR